MKLNKMTAGRKISVKQMLVSALLPVLASVVLCSCRIEPPLRLAENKPVDVTFPEIITELEVIWGNPVVMDDWWYGWDDQDVKIFGPLDYPVPTSYEVRFYYFGDDPKGKLLNHAAETIDAKPFRRSYYYGYHDLLAWSNIDSHDHTQVVLIDESDLSDVKATTTETRLRMSVNARSDFSVYNGPEIFYSGLMPKFYISNDPNDYDYFDEERNVWVKELEMEISPMVYTYLVQVVVYNNNGRVRGVNERTSVSSLARGVSLHTGKTSEEDVLVCFDMRMKKDLKAREGRNADIIGGKLTTYGLCGMDAWIRSRADSHYKGSRTDLENKALLNLKFNNETDSVFIYDITPQMRRQVHGGVITIEIDADTITIPKSSGGGPSAGFDPVVNPYNGEEEHEFVM